MELVHKIENLPTNAGDAPKDRVEVYDCGLLPIDVEGSTHGSSFGLSFGDDL